MGANDKFFPRPASRFIPKEELGEALSWQFDSLLDTEAAAQSAAPSAAPRPDAREQLAHERGHAAGYAAGLAHGQFEAAAARQSQSKQVEQVLADLRGRFAELEENGADQLLDLALEIARQVVRHDLGQVRESLLPLVREAVAQLVDQHGHPRVHLNPADHELIADDLAADASLAGCRFHADPAVARGGCRIETPQSVIDASLANRWARALATLGLTSPWQDDEPAAAPAEHSH